MLTLALCRKRLRLWPLCIAVPVRNTRIDAATQRLGRLNITHGVRDMMELFDQIDLLLLIKNPMYPMYLNVQNDLHILLAVGYVRSLTTICTEY
jgi:hypothetical protein